MVVEKKTELKYKNVRLSYSLWQRLMFMRIKLGEKSIEGAINAAIKERTEKI